jgi:hypothetical protein
MLARRSRRRIGNRNLQRCRTGRPNGELGFHLLVSLHAIFECERDGRRIDLASQCERPAVMPIAWQRDALAYVSSS